MCINFQIQNGNVILNMLFKVHTALTTPILKWPVFHVCIVHSPSVSLPQPEKNWIIGKNEKMKRILSLVNFGKLCAQALQVGHLHFKSLSSVFALAWAPGSLWQFERHLMALRAQARGTLAMPKGVLNVATMCVGMVDYLTGEDHSWGEILHDAELEHQGGCWKHSVSGAGLTTARAHETTVAFT